MVEIQDKEYQNLQARLKELEAAVAKHKQDAEEASRMVTLVHDSNDAIIIHNLEGRITAWNRGAELMFGYSEQEARQMNIWQITPPNKAAEQKDFIRRIFAGENITSFETQRLTKDGRLLDVWLTVTKLVDDAEKVIGLAATERDITKRKGAAEALRESLEKYRRFFMTSRDCVFITSKEGNWIDMNEAAVELFGYPSRAELMQVKISDLYVNPEERTKHSSIITERGYSKEYPVDLRRKDGTVIHTLITAVALRNAEKNVMGFQGTIRDITKRKRIEEALHAANAYNRSLIEASLDPLVTIGADGKITDVNAATEAVTGYPRAELIGTEFSDYFTDPEQARAGYQEVFRVGSVRNHLLELRHRDGHVTSVLYNASVYRDEKGQVVGVFAAARDITERKRAEEKIRNLNAELEQRVIDRTVQLEIANKELDAFAYSISHDLKAPLRAVDGYAQILIEDHAVRLDGEGRRVCEVISNNARMMGKLIDDLLAFSRTGRAEINPAPVDMATLANSIFFELTTPEERERIVFHVAPLPRAHGDPSLLRQVWTNLLGNAVKFSAQKERAVIEVGCGSEGSGHPSVGAHEAGVSMEHLPSALPIPDSERVYFVRDNGAGFDMAYVDKLFDVFQRLHSAKEFEGTGVGLAIVQRIVQRHSGRIWAEGEAGKGAVFYFSIGEA
ncbi:MAG: PAS domain S-box protein [Deltaproteobacteria bacterium]|nr:PAS domain S-box protein [Deltaproteobacteria bacterium]